MKREHYLPFLKPHYNLTDLTDPHDPIFRKNWKYGYWHQIISKQVRANHFATKRGEIWTGAYLARQIIRVFVDEMLKAMVNGEAISYNKDELRFKIIDITHHIKNMRYYPNTKGRAYSPAMLYKDSKTFNRYGRVWHYFKFMGKYEKLFRDQLNNFRSYGK